MLVWRPYRKHPERHGIEAVTGSIHVATIYSTYTTKNPQKAYTIHFAMPGGIPNDQKTTQHVVQVFYRKTT